MIEKFKFSSVAISLLATMLAGGCAYHEESHFDSGPFVEWSRASRFIRDNKPEDITPKMIALLIGDPDRKSSDGNFLEYDAIVSCRSDNYEIVQGSSADMQIPIRYLIRLDPLESGKIMWVHLCEKETIGKWLDTRESHINLAMDNPPDGTIIDRAEFLRQLERVFPETPVK